MTKSITMSKPMVNSHWNCRGAFKGSFTRRRRRATAWSGAIRRVGNRREATRETGNCSSRVRRGAGSCTWRRSDVARRVEPPTSSVHPRNVGWGAVANAVIVGSPRRWNGVSFVGRRQVFRRTTWSTSPVHSKSSQWFVLFLRSVAPWRIWRRYRSRFSKTISVSIAAANREDVRSFFRVDQSGL